ncbi:MAG: methyltransferase family protein, partial [Candidatus Hodarchaeales archaeon]
SKYLEGKNKQLILIIIGQIWIIGIFLYIIFPETHEWFILGLPSWVIIVGLVLTVIGMIFELYTQISRGKHFSAYLYIREDHKLISNGPHRFIRHPMYTALTMVLLGLFLASANIYVGLPLPVFLVVIALRVGKEENVLVEQFGEEYRNYMRRTGRFLPKIRFKSDD